MVLVGAVLEGMTELILFVVATLIRLAPEFDLIVAEAFSQISIADIVTNREVTESFQPTGAILVGEALIAFAIAGKIRRKKKVGPVGETAVTE